METKVTREKLLEKAGGLQVGLRGGHCLKPSVVCQLLQNLRMYNKLRTLNSSQDFNQILIRRVNILSGYKKREGVFVSESKNLVNGDIIRRCF